MDRARILKWLPYVLLAIAIIGLAIRMWLNLL
jgi:hypothetical protein